MATLIDAIRNRMETAAVKVVISSGEKHGQGIMIDLENVSPQVRVDVAKFYAKMEAWNPEDDEFKDIVDTAAEDEMLIVNESKDVAKIKDFLQKKISDVNFIENEIAKLEVAATKRRKPVSKKTATSRAKKVKKRATDKEIMARKWKQLEAKKEALTKLKSQITTLERSIRDGASKMAIGLNKVDSSTKRMLDAAKRI